MKNNTRSIAAAAVIGALYAVLTMVLAPISYGAIQFRVSEALCILPYFLPSTAWGLFIGCAAANMLTGNVLDIVFGSLATLLACVFTAMAGRSWRQGDPLTPPATPQCILGILPPVISNGAIVGAVLAASFTPDAFWQGFAVMGAQVALGEAVVLAVLGLPLMRLLPRLLAQLRYGKGE